MSAMQDTLATCPTAADIIELHMRRLVDGRPVGAQVAEAATLLVTALTSAPAAYQVWVPHMGKLRLFEYEDDAESYSVRSGGVMTPLYAIQR